METGGERIESRVDTEEDGTGYSVETKGKGEQCLHSVETNENEK